MVSRWVVYNKVLSTCMIGLSKPLPSLLFSYLHILVLSCFPTYTFWCHRLCRKSIQMYLAIHHIFRRKHQSSNQADIFQSSSNALEDSCNDGNCLSYLNGSTLSYITRTNVFSDMFLSLMSFCNLSQITLLAHICW